VYDAAPDLLSILYKRVGRGTAVMGELRPGQTVNLLGPLGNGFPLDGVPGALPVLVAGGYGVAPLHFLARRLARRGILFVGGATRRDILCLAEFRALQWPVRAATEDGSLGVRGLVTTALDAWAAQDCDGGPIELFACGPDDMLRAVSERAVARGWTAWLSMDRHMGCAVGACLACVIRVRGNGHAVWARVCREGPVFEARQVAWETP
jgi:dihydroorotate dehydrogenase electron transfer subunit